jgi:hypothetical protein
MDHINETNWLLLFDVLYALQNTTHYVHVLPGFVVITFSTLPFSEELWVGKSVEIMWRGSDYF